MTPADRDEILAQGIDEAVLPSAGEDEILGAFRRLAERHREQR